MRREEFESRIRELLPDVSEKAMDRTISYIEELDQETEECAESLFDAFYVELALVKRDRGAEIAKALFDYGENFTFAVTPRRRKQWNPVPLCKHFKTGIRIFLRYQ